jgi:hypothetical protein
MAAKMIVVSRFAANLLRRWSAVDRVGALKTMPGTWQDLFFPESAPPPRQLML